MLDLIFTLPWSYGLMVLGAVVFLGVFVKVRPRSGRMGEMRAKHWALLLPGCGIMMIPMLNLFVFHLGHASSLTSLGGDGELLWALDAEHRLNLLDGQAGARVERIYLGPGVNALAEDEGRLLLERDADEPGEIELILVDKASAEVVAERALGLAIQQLGIAAPLAKVDFLLGGHAVLHTKDAETHRVDLLQQRRLDPGEVSTQRLFPERPDPLITRDDVRWHVDNHRLKVGDREIEPKLIKGQFVTPSDVTVPVVLHYRTTDALHFDLTAFHDDGRARWSLDEAELFPGAETDKGAPRWRVVDGLLLLIWEGRLAAIDLESGRLRFSVRV